MRLSWTLHKRHLLKYLPILIFVVGALTVMESRSFRRTSYWVGASVFCTVPAASLDEAEIVIKQAFLASDEYQEFTVMNRERHVSKLPAERARQTSGRLLVFQYRLDDGEMAFVDVWLYVEHASVRLIAGQCQVWCEVSSPKPDAVANRRREQEMVRLSKRVRMVLQSAGCRVLF